MIWPAPVALAMMIEEKEVRMTSGCTLSAFRKEAIPSSLKHSFQMHVLTIANTALYAPIPMCDAARSNQKKSPAYLWSI
jgi:hypothetical protein